MENKKDLRVIKTDFMIKSAFIELVQTIGYQKITVKDLCEKAMINRNTFYLHYQDKDDLVKKLIYEAFERYDAKLRMITNSFYANVAFSDNEKFTNNIKDFLLIIYEDIELLRMILVDEYLSIYFKSFEAAYEKQIQAYLNIKTKRAKLVFRFIMSGVGGILADWIVNDTTTIDETSTVLANLIITNIALFRTENRN